MKSERLERVLNQLKNEFYEVGDEWKKTRDKDLFYELNALVGAINEIEIFLHDRIITTLLHAI